MLSGGTEPIVGVMGGGTRKNYRRKNSRGKSRNKSRRKNSRRKRSASVGGGRTPFDIHGPLGVIKDIFKFTTQIGNIGDTFPGIPMIEADGTREEKVVNLNTYIVSQKSLWKRHSANGIERGSAITMKPDSCSSVKYDAGSGENGVGGSDRLGLILPKTTSKIILLPPCRGNQFAYTKCINYMAPLEGDPNTVFIFTPPFYSTMPGGAVNNLKIFDHYATMKKRMNDSPELASVYILSEYTQNALFNACTIMGDSSTPFTLLEPTYIIFPYTVHLDNTAVSGIIFSAAARDEVILPKSGVDSNLGLIGAIQNGVTGGHAWPTNNSKNDPLIDKVKIPYRRYRFLSKRGGDDVLDLTSEYKTFTISQVGDTAATAVSAAAPAVTGEEKFQASEIIFLTGVSYTSVPLGSNEYSLRHPRTPEVVEDWKNLVFTEDEAEFLNDLNLRPKILADIYASTPEIDWKSELAKNMATIVRSKCFNDPRLVLHSDCQVSNNFIQKILDYYVKNDERITSLEFDEVEAEKNELRLRAQAGWDAAAAAVVAVNPAVDKTGWNKNPVTDGLVRELAIKHIDENSDLGIIFNTSSHIYTRTIVLTKKTVSSGDDSQKIIGEISCNKNDTDCSTSDLAEVKLEKLYKQIQRDYPGYTFYP